MSSEQEIIRKAYLSRRVEERLLELFSEGVLFGTVHTCIGQEFSGAVATSFLESKDSIFSNHRCHGHFLSYCQDAEGLIAELMGKETGVCAGRGGSQHICKQNFYSNGIQGGIVPVAAGQAFARKLRKENSISSVFIGDGTLGEGSLYETLNLASKWELPLLIILENNLYAQSTHQKETLAGDIQARARAFDIKSFHGNTWQWQELRDRIQEAVKFVRLHSRPAFVQVDTYRLKAHSKGDDIRSREEVSVYEEKDPLNILLQSERPEILALKHEIDSVVEAAIQKSKQAPTQKSFYRRDYASDPITWSESDNAELKPESFVLHLSRALKELMRQNPKMLMIGEDILSPYGGAFKVTQDLSTLFPEQVRNTPISESAIVGLGTGLAMEGYRPFVEIMFGDFVGLAFDQLLNHAAKFEEMYNGQVRPNLVVRTPMGGGRGYGPTHSQSLEKHFFGIPGLTVLAVNNLIPPEKVYGELLKNDYGPVLLIENKVMYGFKLRPTAPAGFELLLSSEKFPTVLVKPKHQSIDFTLIAYGGMAELTTQALEILFEEYDLVGQLICPTKLYPFELARYNDMICQTANLFVVEEGQGFSGFASEIAAQIHERIRSWGGNFFRIHPEAHCIPASKPAEQILLPSTMSIVKRIADEIRSDSSAN